MFIHLFPCLIHEPLRFKGYYAHRSGPSREAAERSSQSHPQRLHHECRRYSSLSARTVKSCSWHLSINTYLQSQQTSYQRCPYPSNPTTCRCVRAAAVPLRRGGNNRVLHAHLAAGQLLSQDSGQSESGASHPLPARYNTSS